MSDYSSLKATINANIKANNNHEITGAITNSVLNAMVDSLGAGYQFMGVATPTNPGSAQTPDYKCFYLAITPGTYTNLGGLVVNDGEVALLKWDTSWTKVVTGIASADKLNVLSKEVEQFIPFIYLCGDNLINPDTCTSPRYITTSGQIAVASSPGFSVSAAIPVIKDGIGMDIVSNALVVSYAASYAVYDKDFNLLRVSVNTSPQYTYQDGDFYVIFGFNISDKRANYGTTLSPFVPFSHDDRIKKIESDQQKIPGIEFGLTQRVKNDPGTNLIDPQYIISPDIVKVAVAHHERMDGTGYPEGLKGDEIPLEARIMAIADVYDAMSSKRSYRDVLPQNVVREELEKAKRTQLDPYLVNIMIEMMNEDTSYMMREK